MQSTPQQWEKVQRLIAIVEASPEKREILQHGVREAKLKLLGEEVGLKETDLTSLVSDLRTIISVDSTKFWWFW